MGARPPRRRPVEPSFPLIPAMIAVVLAGFAVGGAISYAINREPAVPAPSPTSQLAVATLPLRSPAPLATPAKSPLSTPSASALPSPTPLAAASPAPSLAPSPQATPEPAATASREPAPVPTLSLRPTLRPPVATLSPGVAAAAGDEIDSPLGRDAGGLVRRYLGALIAGDETTAATALGTEASSRGLHLAEEEFIDRSTRITGLRTHTSGNSVTVETDIEATSGSYFERFLVERGPAGLVIREHDFIKP